MPALEGVVLTTSMRDANSGETFSVETWLGADGDQGSDHLLWLCVKETACLRFTGCLCRQPEEISPSGVFSDLKYGAP